ncbi:MAG: sigma-70 family RNA polymerase sigma factor [Aquabacterium sp.]|uniref:sigma-70 family RNA polymerase sigma factor n=1 Tax=Aquabacterium sp. TaxID=1872578 RepID=UPI0025BD8015|nr:sigma-70 family RNA polymerase sigma factor [Aquabacterium sp.]MBI5927444.1 sigma-70 family RNA polymerase sigma factor [Aquabacterium sp.]
MEPTIEFESHRRFLRGLAYRMLGSVAEAEDAVQDCWLRWREVPHADIIEPRAFLAQTLTRLCFDRLRSAQKQREHYVGVWLPEPWIDDPYSAQAGAEEMVTMAQDLEIAFLLVLQRLTPSERAVFLLNEVFDWDFDAIAQVLDRSAAACRQLASRARQQLAASVPTPDEQSPKADKAGKAAPLSAGRPRRGTSPPSPEQASRIATAFAMALQMGDVQALADTLAQDVVFMADGGGKVNSVPRPLLGADKVAQVLVGFARLWLREPGATRPASINGMPGAVFHAADGSVVQTLALEIAEGGRITAIYVMRNPDKLKHVPRA